MQTARAIDRANRQAIQAQQRYARQRERDHGRRLREAERQARLDAKEAKLLYLEERQEEVDQMNEDLAARNEELRTLLLASPESSASINFRTLRKQLNAKAFDETRAAGARPIEPSQDQFKTRVPEPGFIARLFGGQAKYEAAVREAAERDRQAYEAARTQFEADLAEWNGRVARALAEHEGQEAARKREVDDHNVVVEQFERAYQAGEADAVREYFLLILNRSVLPEGFPEEYQLAYIPESKQLVVEHQLPTLDVVPAVSEYTYVKAKDEIREKARKKAEVTDLYRTVIASVALRTLNEIFGSDAAQTVETVVFNGVVHTISPQTGEEVQPCVVSVRTTRGDFSKIVLGRVDPVECLKGLGANVSKRPEELAPVRPVIEFDMVDRRFVAEEDVMSTLEGRPNIMDLNPFEFENLVINMFRGMGLEAKLTRSSRDGGVDCVAFDPRPVLGGKVVIQAKRYKNTVGVSAVRDLYGTMMNEGANKGILVTTAGYGPDAFAFAKDKPIELIDGSGLLYLLDQQGIPARIVMPV
jgi:restriction system protein